MIASAATAARQPALGGLVEFLPLEAVCNAKADLVHRADIRIGKIIARREERLHAEADFLEELKRLRRDRFELEAGVVVLLRNLEARALALKDRGTLISFIPAGIGL